VIKHFGVTPINPSGQLGVVLHFLLGQHRLPKERLLFQLGHELGGGQGHQGLEILGVHNETPSLILASLDLVSESSSDGSKQIHDNFVCHEMHK